MTYITLEDQYVTPFIENNEFIEMSERVQQAHKQLHEKNGIGSNYLGWLDLPETFEKKNYNKLNKLRNKFKRIVLFYSLLVLVDLI